MEADGAPAAGQGGEPAAAGGGAGRWPATASKSFLVSSSSESSILTPLEELGALATAGGFVAVIFLTFALELASIT